MLSEIPRQQELLGCGLQRRSGTLFSGCQRRHSIWREYPNFIESGLQGKQESAEMMKEAQRLRPH